MASVHTNTYGGRTITLEVYEESWSIETNSSVVRWTLRSGTSSTYHSVYQITAWVGGTDDAHKVYGPKTADWSSRAFPCKDGSTTGTITVQHNNDGTASPVTFRLRGSVYNNNPQNYDGSIDLTNIPRYASCSQSLSDANENDMTINWSSDSTIDHVWYSIDNGANWTDVGAVWTNQGTYVIYNLNANTTYNIKTRVRRADSQLTTDSAVAGWTTLAYPYISGLGATSLTIGNNQTLYLYNPKGRQITVYMKKDGYDGNQIFSQTITNNSNTPFTFTPNASTMYNLIPNSRSANCVYYVVYGSNRSGTANGNFVVNENNNRPSISSFTTNDNNSTYSLTNDHSKIVLNATNMSLTINGSGQNGASISGISVNNTALTVSNNSGTYTLNKPPSATFNVVLTDSRGIQTNTNITLQNYVAYFEPILNTNAVRNQPTDGILNLSGNGSFYNGSFGVETNTLDVQYTVTEQSTGTVLETGYMSLTPSGNDFTLQDLQVSNADYQKQYVVSFNAIDKLNTIPKNIPIPKGQPVYWWNGEKFVVIEDFEVKGNTTLNGDFDFKPCWAGSEKRIYWKEDGYGDQFAIKPDFIGGDDDNKLKIQGAVGGSGTYPNLYDLVKISGKSGNVDILGKLFAGNFDASNYWGDHTYERWVNNNGSYDQEFASWGTYCKLAKDDGYHAIVMIGNYPVKGRRIAINSNVDGGSTWSGWTFIEQQDDTLFQHLTMETGFADGWNTGLHVRRKNGIVNVIGYIQTTAQTSWGKRITTLPSWATPTLELDFICRTTWNEVMKIAIQPNGEVGTLNLNTGSDLPANEYIYLCATYIVD